MAVNDRINGLLGSVAIKPPCRVATTANITLSGLQTIDGVTVVAGDRVLVKDQTTATENGIYEADTSAWSRAKDFNGNRDAVQGTTIPVYAGTANGGMYYQVTNANPITIGTTSLTFDNALASTAGMISLTQGVTVQDAIAYITPAIAGGLQSAITYAVANNALLVLNESSYTTDEKLAATGHLSIRVDCPCEITLTSAANTVLSVTGGQLRIHGERLTINGDSLTTYGGIFCSGYLPEIENVTCVDCTGTYSIGHGLDETNPDAEVNLLNGSGYLKNCIAEDCGRGPRIYGGKTPESADFRYQGVFALINCESKGTTGYNGSNTYVLDQLKVAWVQGGTWTGDAAAAPNCYRNDAVVIESGLYHDLLRGPTVGKNCRNFRITGNTAIRCSASGISADLRDDGSPPLTEEYPKGYSIIEGNTMRDCGYPLYIQGKNINIYGNYIDTFTQNTAARMNGVADVYFHGNKIIGCGSTKSIIEASEGSSVRVGKNDTDCTFYAAYNCIDGSASTFYVDNVFIASGSGSINVPADCDLILSTASGAGQTLRFPDMDSVNIRGKTWRVIKLDNAFTTTMAARNGDGTFYGTTVMATTDQYKSVLVTTVDFKVYTSELLS